MLTGKQKRFLRSMANELNPVLQMGKEGLTESVATELDAALEAHELVKIRVLPKAVTDRDELASSLSEAARAEIAQTIGNTIVLYRRASQKPVLELPQ